jgi:hypothetical protein
VDRIVGIHDGRLKDLARDEVHDHQAVKDAPAMATTPRPRRDGETDDERTMWGPR